MSLTSFLRENADVREKFWEEFSKPTLGQRKEILAPPLTESHMLVGTAFDYLLRFHLKKWNPTAKASRWIAEEGTEGLGVKIGRKWVSFESHVKRAKKCYTQFLKSGEVTDELLSSVLALAHLDAAERLGLGFMPDKAFVNRLDNPNKLEIQDLRQLISVAHPEMFRAQQLCLLNPTFGRASALVGGADCDIVLDDALVEIKTTKDFELRRQYFDQLVGYYALQRIGRLRGAPPDHCIKRLGIYFSRFGYLWLFNVCDVVREATFLGFLKWLEHRAIQDAD